MAGYSQTGAGRVEHPDVAWNLAHAPEAPGGSGFGVLVEMGRPSGGAVKSLLRGACSAQLGVGGR